MIIIIIITISVIELLLLLSGHRGLLRHLYSGAAGRLPRGRKATVSSRNLNLRVSSPRIIAYIRFKMPSESSDLPGTGPIFSRLNFGKLAVPDWRAIEAGWPAAASTAPAGHAHSGKANFVPG